MEVYQIYNTINHKSYVGITIFNFKKRYSGGRWWDTTSNQYLKNAAKLYGKENFIVINLAENVKTIEELGDLEKQYIKELNCLFPNGYNFDEGGHNGKFHIETIKKMSLANREVEEFQFIDPNGKIYKVDILMHFCKEHGLDHSSMSRLASGKRGFNSYKGWRAYPLRKTRYQSFSFVDLNGKIVTIKPEKYAFKNFCINNNLEITCMRDAFNQKVSQHKGWFSKEQSFQKKKLVSPSKEIIELFAWELRNISKKYNVSIYSLTELWNHPKIPKTDRPGFSGWSKLEI